MPINELFKWRLDSAQKYDESERSLGDVLDVKSSVALVAVTFLAGVSGELIKDHGVSSQWGKVQLLVQLVALLLLAGAGALIVAELWPRGYMSLPTPSEDADWIAKLEAELGSPAAVLDKVLEVKLSRAILRVEHNKKINDTKSYLIGQTFRFLAVAIVLILGNLLCLAISSSWPMLRWLFCRG